MIHVARFVGIIHKKRYTNGERYGFGMLPSMYQYTVREYWQEDFDEENPLWEGQFDNPILKKDERVHIHTINKNARIVDVVRSTDGSFVYYTDYVIEQIEDEETLSSKLKAEEVYEKWIEARKEDGEDEEELPRSNPRKNSWWKF